MLRIVDDQRMHGIFKAVSRVDTLQCRDLADGVDVSVEFYREIVLGVPGDPQCGVDFVTPKDLSIEVGDAQSDAENDECREHRRKPGGERVFLQGVSNSDALLSIAVARCVSEMRYSGRALISS